MMGHNYPLWKHWCVVALCAVMLVGLIGQAQADKIELSSGESHEGVSITDLKRDSLVVFDDPDGGTVVASIDKIGRIELDDMHRFNLAEEFFAEKDYHSALATYRKAEGECEDEWFAGLLAARIAHCKDVKRDHDEELRAAGIDPDAERSGLTYFVIPIRGQIGREAHVNSLRKCFNIANARNPDVVVLHFDSGGGSIASRDEIIEFIREKKEEFRLVAYVTEAGSAAAAIALLCDEIIMEPGSYIGGCVPFYVDGWGDVRVNEKWLSMDKATLRSLAQEGGHDPLLAEAMIEADMALRYVKNGDGSVELYRNGNAGVCVKERGKIASFSPDQAVKLGLAIGQVETLDKAHELLGFDDWERVAQDGETIQSQWEKELDDAADRYDELVKDFDKEFEIFLTTRSGKEAIRKADELQDILKEARAIARKYDGVLNNPAFPDQMIDDPEELKELEEELEDAEKRLREKY
jgi:hypothetical protein